MALRIIKNGDILCVAHIIEEIGDTYIEELATEYNKENCISEFNPQKDIYAKGIITGWKQCFKMAQSKQFSLEDIKSISIAFAEHCKSLELLGNHITNYKELFDDSIEEIEAELKGVYGER